MSVAGALFPLLALFALLVPFISAAYIAFGLLVAAWALEARRRGALPAALRSPLAFLVALYALLVVLSAVFAREPAASAAPLPGLSLLLLVPIAMDLVDSTARARVLVLVLAAGGFALALYGVWQFLHGGDDLDHRIRATLSHYMTFSGLAMIAACLLSGFLLEGRGRDRWLGLAGLVPLAALLLTYTRGAYLGLAVAALLYLAVRRPRALPLAVPVLAVVFLLAPAGVRERIRSIGDLSDTTNRDRIAMARAGLRMVSDDPIFGLGPDMVGRYYPLYRDPDAPRWRVPHLHNNLLQTAAASGLFAAAAYVALLALFFARAFRLLRRDRDPARAPLWAGVFLAGAALAIAGLFEYNFGDAEVEMATYLILALPFSRAAAPPPAPE